jgi:3-oxoacyl-[acyl-carrier protein] reductase
MSFDELRGKRILITGASTGIGAALATSLGGYGARVGVHYNASADAAEQVAAQVRTAGGTAQPLSGDVCEPKRVAEIIQSFVDAHDGLDVLVCNAGDMGGRSRIEDIDDAHYDHVMDLNARSVFASARAAIPQFRAQGHGNIINTSSIAARNGGGAGVGLYAAGKGFVSTLTRTLAKEHASEGIRVNAVAPGTIDTPFHARHSSDVQLEGARRTIPMGRLGTPEDCVGAYLFLACEGLSGYVTGQIIEVNGGQLMP